LHQGDAAIARYEKALALRPNFPPLETLVGNLYLDKGDLDTARKHYEQALAINPNFAIAASNLAWVYTKQGGNLDVALGLAQKAKQLMPELDSITDTLAWVQYKKGSYISARPLLQDCVRKAPQYAPYHYHLGMVLAASGEKAKAKTELEAALRMKLSAEDATDARQALAKLN
jgi:tetratricopeptide (TPR) repeat protein